MRKESLKDWAIRIDDITRSVDIADWIFSEYRTDFKNLTLEQAKDVRDAMQNIEKNVSKEHSITIRGKEENLINAVKDWSMQKFVQDRKDVYTPKIGGDEPLSARESYLLGIQRPDTVFRNMDNQESYGMIDKLFREPVYKAYNLLSKITGDLSRKERENRTAFYGKDADKILAATQYYDALGSEASRIKLINIACHLGNESSRHVFLNMTPEMLQKIGLGKNKLWVQKDSQATFDNIVKFLGENLTKDDLKYVQSKWNNFEYLYPLANEVELRTKGFELRKVEKSSFLIPLPNGENVFMEGGYYPLREDKRSGDRTLSRFDESSPLYMEQYNLFNPATAQGYTNKRTGSVYAVDLNTTNEFIQINNVAYDIAFREVVNDLRKIVQNSDFKDTVERKYGRGTYLYLRQYVSDIATTSNTQKSEGWRSFDPLFKTLRKHALIAQLMGRMPTTIQNLADALVAGNVVEGFGHSDVAKSLLEHGVLGGYWFGGRAKYNEIAKTINEKSAFMRDRGDAQDASLMEFLNEEYTDGNVIQRGAQEISSKALKWGGQMMSFTDMLVMRPIWLGAYNKQIQSGASEYTAIRYADDLVNRTTGSGRKIDVAPMLRGTNTERMLTMYQSFMNVQLNSALQQYRIAMRDRDFGRLVIEGGARFVVMTIASSFLFGKAPERKDEDFYAKWAKEFVGYPISLFPVVGGLATVTADYALGLKGFDYRLTPIEGIADAARSVSALKKAFEEQSEDKILQFAEMAMKTASYATPYPQQINDYLWNIHDLLRGQMGYANKEGALWGEVPAYQIYKDLILGKRRPKMERG